MNTGNGYGWADSYEEPKEKKRSTSPRPAPKQKASATTPAVMEAIGPLPGFVQDVVKEIARMPYVKEGVEMMLLRSADFRNPTAALLAGIMIDSTAHRMFEKGLDEKWPRVEKKIMSADEVVVGAGFHAAVYCAVRGQMGYAPPLVLEANERVGGIFATSTSPTFYLNSRNRPGDSSVPGQPGSLNVLPGSIVQPSDLGGAEYQTDAEMALTIRVTLAMNATVRTRSRVMSIIYGSFVDEEGTSRNHELLLEDGTVIRANRVVIATGLGKPIVLDGTAGGGEMRMTDRVMTYTDFLRRLDQPFPFRGMERVAVIGAGDSGKTVIEALCGQGPGRHGSVASLDWMQTIDWYGLNVRFRKEFEECNRSRYRGIGRLLTPAIERVIGYDEDEGEDSTELFAVPSYTSRVRSTFSNSGRSEKASQIVPGYNCVYVNERPYDHVIVCTGFRSENVPLPFQLPLDVLSVNGRAIGRKTPNNTIVTIGPAYPLETSSMEGQAYGQGTPFIRENNAALFRYAQRTAQVAMFLPEPQFVAGFARDDVAF